MNEKIKTTALVVSGVFNLICIALFAFALTRNTGSLWFLTGEDGQPPWVNAVFLVSLPPQGELAFGPAELTLNRGEKAAVQFSTVLQGKQLNLDLRPLYDREIVSIEKSGYGIVLTALKPGETVLQGFGQEGIRDFLRVTVNEAPR